MKHHTIQIATALALLASSAVHAQQAVQWMVSDGGNAHWYSMDATLRTWIQAESGATNRGAHLASFTSVAEQTSAFQLTNFSQQQSIWIGLIQAAGAQEPAGGWAWVTGEPISFSGWTSNNPNDDSGENVGEWTPSWGGGWNDMPAGELRPALLEWSTDCNNDNIIDYGQCHDGTLPDYNGNNIPDCCERGEACIAGSYPVQWRTADGGNGHWYWAVADNASFDSQQSMATARGAMVVCVADAEENAFVYRFSRARGLPAIWIGMVQDPWGSEPDGGWRWIDGSGSSWRNWGVGEPNNWQYDEDNCVMIVTPAPIDEAYWPSRWQDYPGFWQIGAIIEWSADCNNDGVVDYGQILPGQLADTNTDGVPDVCQCATNPSLPTCCPGDLDHDAAVGGADIGLLLSNWGPCASACLYDLNNDDKVNGGDLGLLLSGWGPCPN